MDFFYRLLNFLFKIQRIEALEKEISSLLERNQQSTEQERAINHFMVITAYIKIFFCNFVINSKRVINKAQLYTL